MPKRACQTDCYTLNELPRLFMNLTLYKHWIRNRPRHERWLYLGEQAFWSTRKRPGGKTVTVEYLAPGLLVFLWVLLWTGSVGWLPFGRWSSAGKLLESSLLSKAALPGFAFEVQSWSKLKHYSRQVSSESTILLKQLNDSIILILVILLWAVWTFHSFLCRLQCQYERCRKIV